jgi:hypothetical protein
LRANVIAAIRGDSARITDIRARRARQRCLPALFTRLMAMMRDADRAQRGDSVVRRQGPG